MELIQQSVTISLALFFIYKIALKRLLLQKKMYQKALERSRETNKPLMVIGCPKAGVVNKLFQTYQHGDLCLDIDGCSKCNPYDINKNLVDFKCDSFVIFESATFCFSENFPLLIEHVNRVSGGDFYLCGSNVGPIYRLVGRRIYGKFNPSPSQIAVYPFQPSDSSVKYYDISLGMRKEVNLPSPRSCFTP